MDIGHAPTDLDTAPRAAHHAHGGMHELLEAWMLEDGTRLAWRPVRPQDAGLIGQFMASLSRQTRFDRFLSAAQAPTPALLAQMAQVDFRHHQAFIVTHLQDDEEVMVGDARFVADGDAESADFAIVVDDRWQGRGLGQRMLQALAEVASRRGLRWLRGDVREENRRMLSLMKRSGFFRSPHPEEEGMVQGIKLLLPPYPVRAFADTVPLSDI